MGQEGPPEDLRKVDRSFPEHCQWVPTVEGFSIRRGLGHICRHHSSPKVYTKEEEGKGRGTVGSKCPSEEALDTFCFQEMSVLSYG